jgi:hypothetical protein
MVTEVIPEQFLNAKLSILVTEFGMLTDVNPEHPVNASIPMLVTA